MIASDRRSLGDITCLPVKHSAADVACDTWADNVGCAPCLMLVYVICRAQKLLRKVSGGSKCIPLLYMPSHDACRCKITASKDSAS